MTKTFTTAIVATLLLSVVGVLAHADENRDQFDRGLAALRGKRCDDAMRAFAKVAGPLADDESFLRSYADAAKCAAANTTQGPNAQIAAVEAAIPVLRKLSDKVPTDLSIHADLGELLDRKDQLSRALQKTANEPCADNAGKVKVDGEHCCWPSQSWNADRGACTGAPHCPEGFETRPDLKLAEGCVGKPSAHPYGNNNLGIRSDWCKGYPERPNAYLISTDWKDHNVWGDEEVGCKRLGLDPDSSECFEREVAPEMKRLDCVHVHRDLSGPLDYFCCSR